MDLKKVLWTLYWRGATPLRERIEAVIDPQGTEVRDRSVKSPPDPELVVEEVTQFPALARSGSYWPAIAACRGRSGHGGGTRSVD